MIGEACRTRQLPDCEFFLNKRDYPQLKINIENGGVPVEPYGFIMITMIVIRNRMLNYLKNIDMKRTHR